MLDESSKRRAFILAALLPLALAAAGCGGGGGSGPAAPDLSIVEVLGTPSSSVPSGVRIPFMVFVTLRNGGAAITSPFRVGLYLSSDEVIDPATDTLVESQILSDMAAGEDVVLDFLGEFGPLAPGIHRVGVYADDDPLSGSPGAIREGNEGNNALCDPQHLEVYFSTPPAPQIFLAEDTVLYLAGGWVTEGAIRLTWEAVPGVSGYHLYRGTNPITPANPGVLVNHQGMIPGSTVGPELNIHGFVDGTSVTSMGCTAFPTNDDPNLALGIYYYKVFSVDGIGTQSRDGPELIAKHAPRGARPPDILNGYPGMPPPGVETVQDLFPTFIWSSASAPAAWSFAIREPVPGVDPVWIYHGFGSGQTSVSLPYGTVGAFTIKDADPLQKGTVYTWSVIGYDSDGWGFIRGRPLSILTP